VNPGLHVNIFQCPSPKDVPCQKSMHPGQWLMKRSFFNDFCCI